MERTLKEGDVVADRYRIERKIGEGGMGTVYAGRDMKGGMEKSVALKVLHPALTNVEEVRERFLREARSAARLDHPNIVGVTDVGVDGEIMFMVLELLKGESLHERLQRGQPALTEVLDVMEQLLHGVGAAHAHGIVHRDLKPENIFLVASRKGVIVKILDFGIARVDEEGGRRTRTGMLLGTPDYMAPEQLMGEPVDYRADVWAVGVILYEMLVGEVPFKGATPAAIMQAISRSPDPLPLPSSVPEALASIIRCALQRNPAERFQSTEEDERMRLAIGNVAKTLDSPRPSTPAGSFVALEASASEEIVSRTTPRNATETSVAWTTARMKALHRRSRISAIGGSVIAAIVIATIAAIVLNGGKTTRRPTPVTAVASHVASPRPTPVTIVTPTSIPAPSPVEVAVTPPPQVRAPPPLVAARNGRRPNTTPRVVPATVAVGPTPQVPIPVAPPVPIVVEPPAPTPPPPRHPPPRTCANPDGCE